MHQACQAEARFCREISGYSAQVLRSRRGRAVGASCSTVRPALIVFGSGVLALRLHLKRTHVADSLGEILLDALPPILRWTVRFTVTICLAVGKMVLAPIA